MTAAPAEPPLLAPTAYLLVDRRAWVVALLFGVAGFLLFTRHNQFPFFYHTDEPGKVRQILTGKWNYHHPQLLLKSTQAAMAVAGTGGASQPVVEIGRKVSAFYAAAAAALLVLLAWSHGGPRAGVLGGVLLITHPVLYELAHYMKEDCALLAGVAACFLGMELYTRRPTLARAACAGAAAGLATAGKYLGIVVAIVALLVVLGTRREGRRAGWQAALIFLGAAVLVFGAINFEELQQMAGVKKGLQNEFGRIGEQTGGRESGLRIKYLSKFGRIISVPVLLGAGFWIFRRWREGRAVPLATWALMVFPFAFAAVLSVAPVTKERYLLPVYALICVLGALGIAELAAARPFRHAATAAGMLAALAAGWHLPLLVAYDREFSVDDRGELMKWMRERLPADAVVASDRRVHFDFAAREGLLAQRVPANMARRLRYVSELGTFEELPGQGVKYVAVCELDYHTALRLGPKGDAKQRAAHRFYEQLFTRGKLLWERPGGRILYLHPGLRLYELP